MLVVPNQTLKRKVIDSHKRSGMSFNSFIVVIWVLKTISYYKSAELWGPRNRNFYARKNEVMEL